MTPEQYQARRQRRVEKLERQAAAARRESEAAYTKGRQISSMIPEGQPILVGHHSERRHRRDIEKMRRLADKSLAADRRADRLETAAQAAAGNRAIFSDDPEAAEKLRQRIAEAKAAHEMMKETNRLIRAEDFDGVKKLLGEEKAGSVLNPKFGGIGFQGWALSNSTANIRRMEQRLAQIEKAKALPSGERDMGGGIKLRQNTEINRLQIIFPDKPAPEMIAKLKSHGFRWSPREKAWQRHISNAAIWAAQHILGVKENG